MKIFHESGVKLEVVGLNIEKSLGGLYRTGVILRHIEKKERNICTFEVDTSKCATVTEYLEKRNFKVTKKGLTGTALLKHFAISRCGLFFAFIAAFFVMLYFNSTVVSIRISGLEKIDQTQIEECLKENGVHLFTPFSQDTKELEKVLGSTFDKISLVSIIKKGNSLLVNIKEKLSEEELEGDKSAPLVADFEGMITSIKLIQGTLNCKTGDIVKKGDILVYPYTIDSSGAKIEIPAKAEITADIYFSHTETYYDLEKVTERTGNVFRKRTLKLFGLDIFSTGGDNPFSSYEIEETESPLTENNLLPMRYHDILYFETKTTIRETKFSEVRDKIIGIAKDKAHTLCHGENVAREYFTVDEKAGIAVVKYIVVVNKTLEFC